MKPLPVHVSTIIVQQSIAAMGCAQVVKQFLGGMGIGEGGERAYDAACNKFLVRYSETHPEMRNDQPFTPEQARDWLLAIAAEMVRILEHA